MKIYVGNISRESSEAEVKELFEKIGTVENFKLIKDINTGLIKGFGFVDMTSEEDGQKAIDELNGFLFKDRPLTVSIANPNTGDKKKKPFTKGKGEKRHIKNTNGYNKNSGYKNGQNNGRRTFDKGQKKPNPNGGNVNGNREGGNDIGGFYYDNY